MGSRFRTPGNMQPGYDVSPPGTSSFEPPVSKRQTRPSSSASSSYDGISALPIRRSKLSDDSFVSPISPFTHRSKPSTASTAPTNVTNLSAAEIIDRASSDGAGSSLCPPIENREAWFAKQTEQADEELGITLESDDCPDRATLAAVQDIPVYDAEGNAIPFGSLYDPEHTPHQRQLIIFVRWFFCGACQQFVKALTNGISKEDYFNIPTPTSLVIISCGAADLIPQYIKYTDNCTFTILTDPTRELFKKLDMGWSMSVGSLRERPEYMGDMSVTKMLKRFAGNVKESVRDPDGVRKRDVFRAGNMLQIGGEFLFEDGQVIWCHRMKHIRGHVEIAKLRKLLELDT